MMKIFPQGESPETQGLTRAWSIKICVHLFPHSLLHKLEPVFMVVAVRGGGLVGT